MANADKKQILLTNDDGIDSPGLWAAAEALSELGYVWVAAPRDQASGTGRSSPVTSDGRITTKSLVVHGQEWTIFSVGGTPAQVVDHCVLEILPRRPDLIVSGINYGLNMGTSIGISGTLGAAMEGASWGVPALAASLELEDPSMVYSHSEEIDFSVAAIFVARFARMLLDKRMPADVDVLNLNVPYDAVPETGWRVTRISRHRGYETIVERKGALHEEARIGGDPIPVTREDVEPDSDISTVIFDRMVSVTPMSLDSTSRVGFSDLEQLLRRD